MAKVTPVIAAILTVMIGVAAFADDAQAPVQLRYQPAPGAKEASSVVGKLTDLQMNGGSLGINGRVEGIVRVEVKQVEAATGNITLGTEYEITKAEFAGQTRDPKPVQPSEITVAPSGSLVSAKRAGDAKTSGLAALTGGGIPLDAIALMAASLQFPKDEVCVGGRWTIEQEQEIPVLGRATVKTVTRLVKVNGAKATLETDSTSNVPAFEMDNPLLEGKIKVSSGKFEALKVEREFDMERSFITRARGTFRIEMTADMGFGMPTPIAAFGEFDLRPVPVQATAATDEQTAPEAEATPGKPTADGDTKQARRPGVAVGSLAASAGYESGIADVTVSLNGAKSRIATALPRYAPIIRSSAASCTLGVGVAGANAGQLSAAGQVRLGPVAYQRAGSINLRDLLARITAAIIRPTGS